MAEKKLYDIAKIIRSKNSEPFEITLDVLFDTKEVYEKVKNSGIITKECIAKIYHIKESMITQIVFFDQAQGIKITYDRITSSGTCFDTDVYGAQQHVPLGELIVDI